MRAPKTWKHWTRKEEARVAALRLDGLTSAEIAKRLGRTGPSVRIRVQLLRARRASASTLCWLALLQGCPPERELAALLGVTVWAVKRAKQRLKAMGYDLPRCPRRNQYGECG